MNRVLILTAKDTESDAVKTQLLGPIRSERTRRGHRFNIWQLRRLSNMEEPAPDIEVALYETGRGQASAIMYTTHIVECFLPDLVIYLGCAGGDPASTSIGDVLVATEVWNYEKASVSGQTAVKLKGHPLHPDRVVVDECRGVREFNAWRHRLPGGSPNDCEVRFAPAASGEKVIKDTQSATWQMIRDKLSDEIIACETEGHGFLSALEPLKTFGIMIRGISDTLNDKDSAGKGADDRNQFEATSRAAAFSAQVIEEIGYAALRATRSASAPASNEPSEIVTIEVRAKISQVGEIVTKLVETVGAEYFVIKRVEQGSVILVVETDPKSAALAGALYQGRLLGSLMGFSVAQCISSITETGDDEFDAWLAGVRRGKLAVAGPFESEANRRWAIHAATLAAIAKRKGKKKGKKSKVQTFRGTSEFEALRVRLGLSRAALAGEAEVSRSTINKAASGGQLSERVAMELYRTLKRLSQTDLPPFEAIFRRQKT